MSISWILNIAPIRHMVLHKHQTFLQRLSAGFISISGFHCCEEFFSWWSHPGHLYFWCCVFLMSYLRHQFLNQCCEAFHFFFTTFILSDLIFQFLYTFEIIFNTVWIKFPQQPLLKRLIFGAHIEIRVWSSFPGHHQTKSKHLPLSFPFILSLILTIIS